MMKILLVEPNIEGYTLMPSMSLAILKSYVNNKTKHKAEIADFIFNKKNWKEYLRMRIEKFHPDIVGFSVMSFTYNQALMMTKFIKKNYNLPIIYGGIHAILMPEQIINNKEVDMICTCEGEKVLEELLNKNLNCKGVRGIWYKDKDGKVIRNINRELIQDLDALPFPDFDDYDLKKYFLISNHNLPIMASRGCPYNCTYCSNHAIKKKLKGKYVRFRSVKSIIEEIELRIKQYRDKGMKYLFFYDDIFILNKKFVFDFCKKFKEKGLDKIVRWNANVRANLVTDEIIKEMKDAGCYEVRMGVEAGNDYIRNEVYKKDISKEQIFNAVNTAKKYGIRVRLNFIVGAPYETPEMIKETVDLADKVNADYELFAILMPLPETEMKELCEKEGLIEQEGFRNSHEMYIDPVIRTKYTSRKQIKKIVRNIRIYQIRKYLSRGIRMKGFVFLWDLLAFFVYYRIKYGLEIDNAFRFTINRYYLGR